MKRLELMKQDVNGTRLASLGGAAAVNLYIHRHWRRKLRELTNAENGSLQQWWIGEENFTKPYFIGIFLSPFLFSILSRFAIKKSYSKPQLRSISGLDDSRAFFRIWNYDIFFSQQNLFNRDAKADSSWTNVSLCGEYFTSISPSGGQSDPLQRQYLSGRRRKGMWQIRTSHVSNHGKFILHNNNTSYLIYARKASACNRLERILHL